jgi:predicted N-acetyltransferase YhbS
MKDFQLRDAHPQDHESILALTLEANQEYGRDAPEAWTAYADNIRETLSNHSPAEQIVAERDGEILGAVLLYPAGITLESADGRQFPLAYPEVRLLAVKPAARRGGVGRALMEECVVRARKAGAAAIALHTTDLMQVAMRMYERMGFVRAPEADFKPAPEFVIKGYRLTL